MNVSGEVIFVEILLRSEGTWRTMGLSGKVKCK